MIWYTCDMWCGLVAVDVMCTTEALGILKLSSPSSGIVVTCNRMQMTINIDNWASSNWFFSLFYRAWLFSSFPVVRHFYTRRTFYVKFFLKLLKKTLGVILLDEETLILLSQNFLFADSTLSHPLSSSLLTTESLAALLGTRVDRQSFVLSTRTQVIQAIAQRFKRRCYCESCLLLIASSSLGRITKRHLWLRALNRRKYGAVLVLSRYARCISFVKVIT